MLRKVLSKKTKAIVALATMVTLLMSTGAPVAAQSLIGNNELVTAKAASTQKYRNVMYYGDWSIWQGQKQFYPKDIPADQLTHLNFAFMDFDAQGNLQFTDLDAAAGHPLGQEGVTYGDVNGGILNGLQVLKNDNPNLKTGISLGGWSKSGDFTAVCKSPTARANFVKNIMAFIKYTNMDFVDVDWEYPTAKRVPDLCDNMRDEGTKDGCPEDKEYFIQLLQDLRTALDKQGKELGKTYELSVALPAPKQKVDEGIDVKRLFEIVDFANIMTYDMRGAWDPISGHHSALYTNPNDPYAGKGFSVDESVKHYISKGAPSEKIVIGAAYYTRGWERVSNDNVDPKNPGLFGEAAVCMKDADLTPTAGAYPEAPVKNGEGGRMTGTWSYNALDALNVKYPGMKEYWDDYSKVPYLYNETTGSFFTYDNARSIEEKCKYVKENNLGGMIAWMASNDKQTTSTKRDELTNVTKQALYGDADLTDNYVGYDKLDLKVEMSKAPGQFGSGGQLTIKITNNEKLSEAGEVLRTVETSAKSLKNAKVYIETDGVEITGSDYPTPVVKEENGYYVVDYGGLFEGKIWRPGESKTITLKTGTLLENFDGITNVFITQRMYLNSTEYNKQSLVGSSSEDVIINPDGNFVPTISGVKNKKITVGDAYDEKAGVTAADREDGDLTNKIVIDSNVNPRKKGTYTVTYTVKDSKGAVRTATSTVTVRNKTYIEPDNYDPTKNYVTGDIVVYKGHRYELLWYTGNGILPGSNPAVWKDLGVAEVEVEEPNIIDLATVASKYNKKKGDSGFDAECDLNKDDIIDLFDLVTVAKTM
ncbi:MAG: glycosyl hydrolase family 18 protein [Clostridium sp.]